MNESDPSNININNEDISPPISDKFIDGDKVLSEDSDFVYLEPGVNYPEANGRKTTIESMENGQVYNDIQIRLSKKIEITNLSGSEGIVYLSEGDSFLGLIVVKIYKMQYLVEGKWVTRNALIEFEGILPSVKGRAVFGASGPGMLTFSEESYDNIPALVLDNGELYDNRMQINHLKFQSYFGEVSPDNVVEVENVELELDGYTIRYLPNSSLEINSNITKINGSIV